MKLNILLLTMIMVVIQ